MKKMNILLSVLTLAVMAVTPAAAFAEEDGTQETTETVQTTTEYLNGFTNENDKIKVSVTRKGGYTVTIPDIQGEIENGKEVKVSVNAVLRYNKSMFVTVHSKNQWKLADEAHEENTIPYRFEIDGKAISGESAAILEARYDAENHDSSVTLTANGIIKPAYAGTYSDLLTFTIEEGDSSPEAVSGGETTTENNSDDNGGA